MAGCTYSKQAQHRFLFESFLLQCLLFLLIHQLIYQIYLIFKIKILFVGTYKISRLLLLLFVLYFLAQSCDSGSEFLKLFSILLTHLYKFQKIDTQMFEVFVLLEVFGLSFLSQGYLLDFCQIVAEIFFESLQPLDFLYEIFFFHPKSLLFSEKLLILLDQCFHATIFAFT